MLLPDLLPVYGAAVVRAEGDQFAVGRRIVDAAPLDPLDIIVILVHEVHDADEERVPVELPERVEVLADQGLADHLPELRGIALLPLLYGVVHALDAFEKGLVLVDGPALPERLGHVLDRLEEACLRPPSG